MGSGTVYERYLFGYIIIAMMTASHHLILGHDNRLDLPIYSAAIYWYHPTATPLVLH